jgi:hypothetical protein
MIVGAQKFTEELQRINPLQEGEFIIIKATSNWLVLCRDQKSTIRQNRGQLLHYYHHAP